MSQRKSTGPYVYQTFGSVTHPNRAASGRLFGVGGVDGATMQGLTKEEAQAIVSVLQSATPTEPTP